MIDKSQRAQQTPLMTGDDVPLLGSHEAVVPSVEIIGNNDPGRLSILPSINSHCQAADSHPLAVLDNDHPTPTLPSDQPMGNDSRHEPPPPVQRQAGGLSGKDIPACSHDKDGVCAVHGAGARETWKYVGKTVDWVNGRKVTKCKKKTIFVCDVDPMGGGRLKQQKISFLIPSTSKGKTLDNFSEIDNTHSGAKQRCAADSGSDCMKEKV